MYCTVLYQYLQVNVKLRLVKFLIPVSSGLEVENNAGIFLCNRFSLHQYQYSRVKMDPHYIIKHGPDLNPHQIEMLDPEQDPY
jgi:hypothetical protein